jgi:hypothetical protein
MASSCSSRSSNINSMVTTTDAGVPGDAGEVWTQSCLALGSVHLVVQHHGVDGCCWLHSASSVPDSSLLCWMGSAGCPLCPTNEQVLCAPQNEHWSGKDVNGFFRGLIAQLLWESAAGRLPFLSISCKMLIIASFHLLSRVLAIAYHSQIDGSVCCSLHQVECSVVCARCARVTWLVVLRAIQAELLMTCQLLLRASHLCYL